MESKPAIRVHIKLGQRKAKIESEVGRGESVILDIGNGNWWRQVGR